MREQRRMVLNDIFAPSELGTELSVALKFQFCVLPFFRNLIYSSIEEGYFRKFKRYCRNKIRPGGHVLFFDKRRHVLHRPFVSRTIRSIRTTPVAVAYNSVVIAAQVKEATQRNVVTPVSRNEGPV